MIELELHYHPITRQYASYTKGRLEPALCHPHCGTGQIHGWIHRYLRRACEVLNESAFQLRFFGTSTDCEEVAAAIRGSTGASEAVRLTSGRVESVDFQMIHRGALELLRELQTIEPGELSQALEREIAREEFRVAVIATMSAGKSTLINAMLGRSLLPSRNQATTALLYEIVDVDGLSSPRATCVDSEGRELARHEPVDRELLEQINASAETAACCRIEVDVPGVPNLPQGQLMLIDTPGPNNAGDRRHAEITRGLIRDEAGRPTASSADVVLYVLDAGHLGTEDDARLLEQVAEFVKRGGSASRDRFVFVLNKLDALRPSQGEEPEDLVEAALQYLQRFGIEAPWLVPTAAHAALLERRERAGDPLDEESEMDLQNYRRFLSRRRIVELSTIPAGARRAVEEALENGSEAPTVAHSGVLGIEKTLEHYLHKYWVPMRTHEVLDEVRRKLLTVARRAELETALVGHQEDLEAAREVVAQLGRALEEHDLVDRLREHARALRAELDQTSPALETFTTRAREELGKLLRSGTEAEWKGVASRIEKAVAALEGTLLAEAHADAEVLRAKVEEALRFEFEQGLRALFETTDVLRLEGVSAGALIGTIDFVSAAEKARKKVAVTRKVQVEVKRTRSRWNPLSWIGLREYTATETKEVKQKVTVFEAADATKVAMKRWDEHARRVGKAVFGLKSQVFDECEIWAVDFAAEVTRALEERRQQHALALQDQASAEERARAAAQRLETHHQLSERLEDLIRVPWVRVSELS